ncbi:Alpha/beta knot methyltransferase [Dunaliella salina]|uniref:16S rRNA (uracil(1498)-N(3))-methyltransferase n=1 Tax=Dunaliella salina TaxID=3046 RepID=A0ABQ7H9R4_DUNSA|nr:Alpha/beta knot methyltransferase [Dunaliella salina]|eukprot:KAF5843589.1 Alpha/beta knot methyltransferase [Dunaliella salina]
MREKEEKTIHATSLTLASGARRSPRFYVQHSLQTESPCGGILALEQDEGRHALKALRLVEGCQVELCDGRGSTLEACITAIEKSACRALLEPVAAPVYHPWQGPSITLAVACTTLKGGRADWLVEKACELGARSFVPLVTARSQPTASGNKYRPAGKGKGGAADISSGDYVPSRLERVAIAATKQSLRTHAMVLEPPRTLESFLPQLKPTGRSLSLVAAAGAEPLAKQLQAGLQGSSAPPPQPGHTHCNEGDGIGDHHRDHDSDHDNMGEPMRMQPPQGPDNIVLLVGPEGDWTAEELATMVDVGAARPVGLGMLRLRTETAAISLLAATSNMLLNF